LSPLDLDARCRRLRAALAAVLVRADAPELRLMHQWLDSWSGIGLIVVGMSHQGYTVSLGEHGVGRWIAPRRVDLRGGEMVAYGDCVRLVSCNGRDHTRRFGDLAAGD
jgi:hypothetical protein